MLQRLDVHDGALGLLGGGDGPHLQGVGVLLQQLVGHLRHGALSRRGLTAVLQPQRQHHLALPQGNGVHQRGLDLLDHQRVVVLQQPGLGAHLHRHHPGQLQIVDLLFKPVAQVHQIVIGLCVLCRAGLLRLLAKLLQLAAAYRLQPLLTGQNVHGQFLVVLQVQLIHLVEHGHVLEQRDLVLLQRLGDLLHVGLHLAVLGLHALQSVPGLLEQAHEALLFFAVAEALQLHHQTAQVLPDLAQILAANVIQGALGETRHALLCGGAVLQDHVGIPHIDLVGKLLHRLLLLVGQELFIHLHRLDLLLLRLRHFGSRRLQRQLGNGLGRRRRLQGQFRHHVVCHGHSSFLSHIVCLLTFPERRCPMGRLLSRSFYSSSWMPSPSSPLSFSSAAGVSFWVWWMGSSLSPSRAIMFSSTVISVEISSA